MCFFLYGKIHGNKQILLMMIISSGRVKIPRMIEIIMITIVIRVLFVKNEIVCLLLLELVLIRAKHKKKKHVSAISKTIA